MIMNDDSIEDELAKSLIPENFVDTGRCFNGAFKTRNFIEASVVALPVARLLYEVDLPLEQKISLTIIVAGVIFGLFIVGINEDSVFEFIQSYFSFRKRKRIARYNPRVKSEASPGYLTKSPKELPRDKMLRLIDEFATKNRETEDVSRDIYDPIYKEYFEDDLGILNTPENLKSKGEKKREAKAIKKALKLEKKQAKELANKQAKEQKQADKLAKKADKLTKKTYKKVKEGKKGKYEE